MGIDVSRFKVVHSDKVYNALAIMEVHMPDMDYEKRETFTKAKFLNVLIINEDGNVVSIHDEAWTFQFIPITAGR